MRRATILLSLTFLLAIPASSFGEGSGEIGAVNGGSTLSRLTGGAYDLALSTPAKPALRAKATSSRRHLTETGGAIETPSFGSPDPGL
jgi:hypothetical protein